MSKIQASREVPPLAGGPSTFLSYSHDDIEVVKEGLNFLRQIRVDGRSMQEQLWFDADRIKAGEEWEHKIESALKTCTVFIVVLSENYSKSPFCMQKELRRILERRQQVASAGAPIHVFAIALRSDDLEPFALSDGYTGTQIDKLQCIPTGPKQRLKPVQLWQPQWRAWEQVKAQINQALSRQVSSPVAAHRENASTSHVATAELPYLCDRKRQVIQLQRKVGEWRTERFKRPLLVLTEGREVDLLDRWVRRMHGADLPNAIWSRDETRAGSSADADPPFVLGRARPLEWPQGSRNAESARSDFEALMAMDWFNDASRPLRAVQSAMRRQKLRTFWSVSLYDNDDMTSALHAFDGLLQMLGAWPDTNAANWMAVSVTIVRRSDTSHQDRSLLALAFESRLLTSPRVTSVSIGSLPDVSELAIDEWAQKLPGGAPLRQDLLDLKSELPGRRSALVPGAWPMRAFAKVAEGWFR